MALTRTLETIKSQLFRFGGNIKRMQQGAPIIKTFGAIEDGVPKKRTYIIKNDGTWDPEVLRTVHPSTLRVYEKPKPLGFWDLLADLFEPMLYPEDYITIDGDTYLNEPLHPYTTYNWSGLYDQPALEMDLPEVVVTAPKSANKTIKSAR